jgi:transposase, IS5 family
MAFVVMCAEKIRRLLRLFFITIFGWIYAFQRPGSLWMALRKILQIETHESLATG